MLKTIIKVFEEFISEKKQINKGMYTLRKRDMFFRDTDEPFAILKDYSEVIELLRKQHKNDLERFTLDISNKQNIECANILNRKIILKQLDSSLKQSCIGHSFNLCLENKQYNIYLSAKPSLYTKYTEVELELYDENNKILHSLSTELKFKYYDDNINIILEDISNNMIDLYYKKFINKNLSFKLLKNLLDCSVCDYIQYDFIKEEYPA